MVTAAPAPAERDLVRDQRGAIMMIGLFMACSLVGALWFMMGIGDAIIFKDGIQEATDHAAFSAAVTHARGMNLIAAVNLMMFVLVALYVVAGVIQDIVFVLMLTKIACGVAGGVCLTPPAAACCAEAANYYNMWSRIKNLRSRYLNGIKRIFPLMSRGQSVAAVVYPYFGTAYGLGVGAQYGHYPVALSPSMVHGNVGNKVTGAVLKYLPGFSGSSGRGAFGSSSSVDVDSRLGLPVKKDKPGKLCELSGRFVLEWMMTYARNIPGIGNVLGNDVVRKILGYAAWTFGNILQARYCSEGGASSITDLLSNKAGGVAGVASKVLGVGFDVFAALMNETDSFWGDKDAGPKTMWLPARNGSEWTQIWAFTYPEDYKEQSEPKVGMAATPKGAKATPKRDAAGELLGIYFARAEFYFDCKEEWDDADCNGQLALSYTTFAMRWRARERRFRMPDWGSMFVEWGTEALLNGKAVDFIKSKIPDWLGGSKVGKAILDLRNNNKLFKKLFDGVLRSKNGKGALDWLLVDQKSRLYKWYHLNHGTIPNVTVIH